MDVTGGCVKIPQFFQKLKEELYKGLQDMQPQAKR